MLRVRNHKQRYSVLLSQWRKELSKQPQWRYTETLSQVATLCHLVKAETTCYGKTCTLFYSHIRNKNPVAVRGNLWYQQGQQHIKQWRTTSLHFTAVNLTITQQKDDNPKNYNKAQNLFKILLGFWIVQRENHNPSYTINFAPYVNIFKQFVLYTCFFTKKLALGDDLPISDLLQSRALLWGKACNTPKRENTGIQTIPLLPSPIQPTYFNDMIRKHQKSESALPKQTVDTFFFSFSTLTDLTPVV